jgi:hypothetical protein
MTVTASYTKNLTVPISAVRSTVAFSRFSVLARFSTPYARAAWYTSHARLKSRRQLILKRKLSNFETR